MQITVDEVRALGEGGVTVINVGAHAGAEEIRGAIRYRPHDLLTPEHLALPIAAERPVVLYDEDGRGDLTTEIAGRFTAQGYDARVLKGGFRAWKQGDGPTQEPSLEQVVPPFRPAEVQELDRRL